MGPVRLPRCSIPASPVPGVAALFSFPTFQHIPLGLPEALCKGSKAWASLGWAWVATHVPLPFLWHTGNKCALPGAMRLNTLLLASLLCWGWKNGVVLFQHCSSFAPSQGGGGALARECVSLYPNCTVTIYDLPKVVQVAKDRFIPPEEQRIAFHEGKCGHYLSGCWWAAAECSSAGLQVTEASSTWLLTWEISDQKCPCTALPWEASTWKGVRQESSFPSLWI